jgi:hypothetical protein
LKRQGFEQPPLFALSPRRNIASARLGSLLVLVTSPFVAVSKSRSWVRANLLAGLAGSLLALQAHDLSKGLRLLRDELLSLSTSIRELEPEVDVNELLTHPPSHGNIRRNLGTPIG